MTNSYPWTKAEIQIIKAVHATTAGRLALDIIVERLGMLDGDTFHSDPSLMAWFAGRRFVAREIKAAILNPVDKLVNDDDSGSSRPLSATERAARIAAGEPRPGIRRRGPGV